MEDFHFKMNLSLPAEHIGDEHLCHPVNEWFGRIHESGDLEVFVLGVYKATSTASAYDFIASARLGASTLE